MAVKIDDESRTSYLLGALDMAREALDAGDHPYGTAIVTEHGSLLERNRAVTTSDPTAHSEMLAIRNAAAKWGTDSVRGSVMLTSNQPCPMCFCAALEAGVGQLILAVPRTASDPELRGYTVEKMMDLTGATTRIPVTEGVLVGPTQEFYASIQ